MRKVHKERLLKVARALRESAVPEDFTMRCFVNECGTPACALGHYAARRDLQRAFRISAEEGTDVDGNPAVYYYIRSKDGVYIAHDVEPVEHFGLDEEQAEELFGGHGCGNAKTPKAAARYIERFVARQA
jgi:hypothetical protein